MRLLQWLCVRSARLTAVLALMLALFAGVESMSLAQAPQPSVASLALSPLSPDRELALQPKDTFTECVKCPEMVVVPAGEFTMGSPETEAKREKAEGPQHKVTFARPFAVSKFEVTFDDWDACVASDGCDSSPSDESWGRGRQPVINVSWNSAKQYVAWLSTMTGKAYRLLSEAEWEYAARAGTQTAYFWGDEIGKGKANCYGCGSKWDNRTAPVGSFAPNAFGLYDMHGNVAEHVEDCAYNNYEGAPGDGSAWIAGGDCSVRVTEPWEAFVDMRVSRGGSYFENTWDVRSAVRRANFASFQSKPTGFRIARTLNP